MITLRNEKLIQRNKGIGTFTGIMAIVVLGLGTYLSFRYREQVNLSLLALLAGLLLYQISIYYSNRFVRSPRPDQELDAALKGLDDSYALYHYQTPVSHLLVGPSGVWVLQPFNQRGKITYHEKSGRWKQKGGNLYMRIFAQENLGRPDREIQKGRTRLQKEFAKIPDLEVPEIKAALVFTNPEAEVEADHAPIPTLHALQLKKVVRKEAKGGQSLPRHAAKTIQDHLGLN